MFIQTETTPNPNAVKFIPGTPVSPERTFDFRTPEEAMAVSPLGKMLFEIGDVTGVYLGKDFISVTKDETSDWAMIKPRVLAAIMDHGLSGLPAIDESAVQQRNDAQSSDPIVVQIMDILDERVRPAVANDGGDVVFDRFEDGILYLHMRGACAGCPSATMTLKQGIESMMKHFVPEVQEVRQIL
jgi:Fe-S cluster biogenesis protein NfuA